MSVFNTNSRTANVVYSSTISTVCNGVNVLVGFVYRTIFLSILSASYLGINGLFTNILQVLSLADLGIAVVITYRFYEPISREDVHKVGELMQFFKKVYILIFFIIAIIGLSIYPFLDFFIKDTSEVPADVNLNFIYLLFLMQSLSTYIFSCRVTLLYADQKQYIMSLIATITTVAKYAAMVIVLYIFKDFTLTLIINIGVTILSNIAMSLWVTRQYPTVFAVKDMLPRDECITIFKDTGAMMCHKIGGTVLTSTDNLILTKFIGILVTGIYSNYSLIFQSLFTVLNQLLGTFTSSFGNAYVELSPEENYRVFRKLQFVNFWLSSMCAMCFFLLINDFITIWVGKKLLLDLFVVITLSAQFWVETVRQITTSYTSACGLFVRDKARPLIEAALNLGISIYLAIEIGIAGIFIGTIISNLLTVSWREPLLVFRYVFKRSVLDYWKMFAQFLILTLVVSSSTWYLLDKVFLPVNSFVLWIIKALLCVFIFNLVATIIFRKTEEYQFFLDILKTLKNKLQSKFKKQQ